MINMGLNIKSLKTLIIGAGSGRDIASAILVRETLRDCCPSVDLAGFLTPWALHTFNGIIEQPVNPLSKIKSANKFILTKEDIPLDVFFEPLLERCNKKYDLRISNIYLFSLQYGTYLLAKEIKNLIKLNNYDTIFVVDVGGDILADEIDYPTLLTPLVDLTCLDLVSEVPSPVNIYLSVIAPGVCGEIHHERMTSIIEDFRKSNFFIEKTRYTENSLEYQKFDKVNSEINLETASYSHTEQIIQKIIQFRKDQNFKSNYKRKYKIGEKEYLINFPVEIGKEYFNSIYYFDLREIKSARKKLTMKYHSVLEGYLKIRYTGICGTEIDLSFVPAKFIGGKYESPIFLLTPCCYTDTNQRKDILRQGFKMVLDNRLNFAIILKKDKDMIPQNINIDINNLCKYYCLLSNRHMNKDFINYISMRFDNIEEPLI